MANICTAAIAAPTSKRVANGGIDSKYLAKSRMIALIRELLITAKMKSYVRKQHDFPICSVSIEERTVRLASFTLLPSRHKIFSQNIHGGYIMSITPLIVKRNETTADEGWIVAVRLRQADGTLKPTKKTFPRSKGYQLRDAQRYERGLLKQRDETELKLRFGPVAAADPGSSARTIEEMAEYYFQHEAFTEIAPSSQKKIRTAIAEFLSWNRQHGTPLAKDWTPAIVQKRMNYLRYEIEPHGSMRTDPERSPVPKKGRRGQGVAYHAVYNKKLFSMELARKPSVLTENPWPAFKRRKTDLSQLDPRAYSPEELAALFASMEPYEKLLFTFLYATGCRSSELLNLRRDRISLDANRQPTHVTFVKTKNHKPRTLRLNDMAEGAVAGLLLEADDSGYLVRREFLHSRNGDGAKITTPLLRALDRIKLRAVEQFPEHRHAFLARVDEDDPRSRFVTNVHTFRATFVTELLLQNVSAAVIARMIGNTVGILLKHYAGLLARGEEEAVHKLPGIKNYGSEHTTKTSPVDRPLPSRLPSEPAAA